VGTIDGTSSKKRGQPFEAIADECRPEAGSPKPKPAADHSKRISRSGVTQAEDRREQVRKRFEEVKDPNARIKLRCDPQDHDEGAGTESGRDIERVLCHQLHNDAADEGLTAGSIWSAVPMAPL